MPALHTQAASLANNSSTSWQSPSTSNQVTLSSPLPQTACDTPDSHVRNRDGQKEDRVSEEQLHAKERRNFCCGVAGSRGSRRMTSRRRDRGGFNDILMTEWTGGCSAPAAAQEERAVRRAIRACIAVNRCLLCYAPTQHVSIQALIIHDKSQEQWRLQLCMAV